MQIGDVANRDGEKYEVVDIEERNNKTKIKWRKK